MPEQNDNDDLVDAVGEFRSILFAGTGLRTQREIIRSGYKWYECHKQRG